MKKSRDLEKEVIEQQVEHLAERVREQSKILVDLVLRVSALEAQKP